MHYCISLSLRVAHVVAMPAEGNAPKYRAGDGLESRQRGASCKGQTSAHFFLPARSPPLGPPLSPPLGPPRGCSPVRGAEWPGIDSRASDVCKKKKRSRKGQGGLAGPGPGGRACRVAAARQSAVRFLWPRAVRVLRVSVRHREPLTHPPRHACQRIHRSLKISKVYVKLRSICHVHTEETTCQQR